MINLYTHLHTKKQLKNDNINVKMNYYYFINNNIRILFVCMGSFGTTPPSLTLPGSAVDRHQSPSEGLYDKPKAAREWYRQWAQ